MTKSYTVEITEVSKDLSAKDRIKFKDLTNAHNLNSIIEEQGSVEISVDTYGSVKVHNDRSDDKDYEQFIIIDTNGEKYYTGSQSFIESFYNLADELSEEGIDEFVITCYGVESKNYKGRKFLSCSLA